MIAELVHPLQRFLDNHRKLSTAKKEQIDGTWKRLEKQRLEVEALHTAYTTKCEAADTAENAHRNSTTEEVPAPNALLDLGPRSFTVDEFNNLLGRMQQDIKMQDVKSLLSTYKSCVNGEDVVHYLRTKLMVDQESAMQMLADLTNHNFLRPAGRNNKSSLLQIYQWKRLQIEDEPLYRKARREADRSEFEYRKNVKSIEDTRLTLEGQCIDYMNSLQHAETGKIALFKECMIGLNDAQKSVAETTRVLCEQGHVYLEMLSPQKEVEHLIEKERTGNVRIPPTLYLSYNRPHKAVFGVPLEELTASQGRRVPTLVKKCIRALEQGTRDSQMTELDMWLDSTMNYTAVHALRNILNEKKATVKLLRKRATLPVIVGVLKLYLIELPVSVCGHEIYEPLKLLYLSKTDDMGNMRSSSLKSLLATLSPPHYQTLAALSAHWHKMVRHLNQNDPKIAELAQLLGPYVLRPKVETRVTLHDKHPVRLMKDLLLHHDEIYSPTSPPPDLVDDGRSLKSIYMSDADDTDEDDEEEVDAVDDSISVGRPSLSRETSHSSLASSVASKRTSLTLDVFERSASLLSAVTSGGMFRKSESADSVTKEAKDVQGVDGNGQVGDGAKGEHSPKEQESPANGHGPTTKQEKPVPPALSLPTSASPAVLPLQDSNYDSEEDDFDVYMRADGVVVSRDRTPTPSAADLTALESLMDDLPVITTVDESGDDLEDLEFFTKALSRDGK
ncbi:hypothetical protein HK104_006422 [Borealophlyctis nickersoniae]|nr:hypothetical protein HK104_006422 [Borealophlyctis nickersoniae]